MRILVIGNGFIATSLVKHLESENHELLVFSRKLNETIKKVTIYIIIIKNNIMIIYNYNITPLFHTYYYTYFHAIVVMQY